MQCKFAVMLFFLCSNGCMTKYRDSSAWHGPQREASLAIIDPAVAHVQLCLPLPAGVMWLCVCVRYWHRGLYFSKALFEGLILCFKIDWLRSLQLKGNLLFLLCFTLYLRAISKYKPPSGHIWRDDVTEGFLPCEFGGLIFGGAYTRRGIFSGILRLLVLFANLQPDFILITTASDSFPQSSLSRFLSSRKASYYYFSPEKFAMLS